MSDVRKFIIHSDYPMDKVVFMKSGQITVPATGHASIAHGLPFAPLLMGSWSPNADFSVSYDFTFMIYAPPNFNQIDVYADSTNINFESVSGNQQTIYYRIYAFAPSDYTGSVAIPNVDTGFRMNSDFNYMKLFASGKTTIAPDGNATISHGLGFIPTVIVWTNAGNGNYKHTVSDYDPVYGREVNVTSSQILLHNLSQNTSTTFHYRIYYDD